MAEIDEHIGVAMSGLTADARTLIDHGGCPRGGSAVCCCLGGRIAVVAGAWARRYSCGA